MTRIEYDDKTFEKIKQNLVNEDNKHSLSDQYRALFTMKAIGQQGDKRAVDAVYEAIQKSDSCLLKHELAYILGQMQLTYALPFLDSILEDGNQDMMVRHEAAESLGAISDKGSLPILNRYFNDETVDISIRETCEISIKKIEFDHRSSKNEDNDNEQNQIPVIDPAPATLSTDEIANDVEKLKEIYLNDSVNLFERYRAMFGLRNIILNTSSSSPNHEKALRAIADGFKDKSALFRHEVAYVFGQIDSPAAVPFLLDVLYDNNENEMVRHEAAETLGGLSDQGDGDKVKNALLEFANSKDAPKVIVDSCIVALDMWEHEASGNFQYADGIEKAQEA